MKMYFFIFGFQRRVWWPKWTPASSRSFMVTSLIRLSFGCSSARPDRGADRRCRACEMGPRAGARSGPGRSPRAMPFLPLRELEALACAGLPVLLALLHPGVAGQHAFLAQHGAQRLVEAHQR